MGSDLSKATQTDTIRTREGLGAALKSMAKITTKKRLGNLLPRTIRGYIPNRYQKAVLSVSNVASINLDVYIVKTTFRSLELK